MDLKCRKTICKHNDKYACMAKTILIGDKTECTTYEKDAQKKVDKLQDVSKTMFESAPELSKYRHNQDCNIKCTAQCLFNKEGKCHANGITVLEGKADGICGTFIEK